MQHLFEQFVAGTLPNRDEVAEALMLALIQLPHYLDRLDAGHADPPISLLATINDLRGSRAARPISAAELLAPQSIFGGPERPTEEAIKTLALVAGNARPHFHRCLLQAVQGGDDQGFVGLGKLFSQLHRFFPEGLFRDAFRAAEGLVHAILDGSLAATPPVKATIAHVDNIFKPLLAPVPSWPEPQARQLISEALGFLAEIDPSGPLVLQLKGAYDTPQPGANDAVSHGPSALGSEALASLAGEVLRDLAGIKDRLDLFVRGGSEAPDQLASMEFTLRQLANTLAIGEDVELVGRLNGLADGIGDLVRGRIEPGDDFLPRFAEQLLAAEDGLRQVVPSAERGDSLLTITLREARADLAKARQAIADYALAPGDDRRLRDAPETLPKVAAALSMLGEDAAATVLQAVADVLRRRFIGAGHLPERADLDLFAEAITGVDLYMEGLGHGASFGNRLLEQARTAVDALGAPQDVYPPASADTGQGSPDQPASQASRPVPSQTESPTDIDPELLDIFLEEARGEQVRIEAAVARWIDDTGDVDALTDLRRSFHTLKGSGRLVGATRLADLAAITETLLDRIFTGRLAPTEAVIGQIASTAALLPSLINAEATATPIELDPLLRAANELLGTEAAAATRDEPVAEHGADAIDQELLDIFSAEAREHLATLTEFLSRVGAAKQPQSEPDMVRALHTLCGSARMTGIQPIAEVSGALERLINDLNVRGQRLDPHLCSLLERATDGIAGQLNALPEFGQEAEDLDAIAREASEWRERLAAEVPVLSWQPERGLDALPEAQVEDSPTEEADVETLLERLAEPGEGLPDLLAETEAWASDPLAYQPAPEQPIPESLPLAPDLAQPPIAGEAEPEPIAESVGSDSGPSTDEAVPGLAAETEVVEPEYIELTAALDATEPPLDSTDEPQATDERAAALQAYERPVGSAAEPEGAEELAEPPADLEAAEEPVNLALPPEISPDQVDVLLETEAQEEPTEPSPSPSDTRIPVSESVELQPTTAPPSDAVTTEEAISEADEEPSAQSGLDPELTALFLEDARDILDSLDKHLRMWQLAPEAPEPLPAIQRLLHTLKGSARLSGLGVIGDLSHALESTLAAIGAGDLAVSDDALELAQHSLDTLSSQADALEQGAAIPVADDLVAALGDILLAPESGAEPVALARLAPSPADLTPAIPAAETPAPAAHRTAPAPASASPQIRVRADLLNRLINNSGEISIYRARLAQQNGTLGYSLSELDQTVARLRDQLRHLDIETEAQILYRYDRELSEWAPAEREFDPLELDRFSTLQQLSRSISETVNDLVSLKTLLADLQRESSDLLVQQARIAEDLQDGLLRTRMVPFVQLVPRLHRLVRQTAQAIGKRATLDVHGPEVELDRSILDRLSAPLEHLLRNAVAHGIESPSTRRVAGKAAEGAVVLVLSREGNDVLITLSDDGAGMDLERIRNRAVKRGMLVDGSEATEEQLLQLAMEPGFTTADHITQIAGRGVGLDVVASELKRLSGSVALDSKPGLGTTVSLRLPLTLAIIDALLVTAGDATYAIPHTSIAAVSRIPRTDLELHYRGQGPEFIHLGETYRVMLLDGLLHPGAAPELGDRQSLPLLLVRTADQHLALQVDSLIGTQRIVVKPLGPQLSALRWLNGGTILPDGRVAMILDLVALARSPAVHAYRLAGAQVVDDDRSQACVMVVDDSLTVRRVTERLLRRQNMDVLTAKDGVEALTMLEERVPDLILLDIEMPRMDGYELTRHIRRSARLKTIPIIMITSRTGEKHRRLATELGVDRYLGKPYQETELLDEISAVLLEGLE